MKNVMIDDLVSLDLLLAFKEEILKEILIPELEEEIKETDKVDVYVTSIHDTYVHCYVVVNDDNLNPSIHDVDKQKYVSVLRKRKIDKIIKDV